MLSIRSKSVLLSAALLIAIPGHAGLLGEQLKSALGAVTDKATDAYLSHQNTHVPATMSQTQPERLLRLDYQGFTIWLDCQRRSAVKFQYNAQRDSGNLERKDKFSADPAVPRECQQTSAGTYKHKYDRGHMVPANHLDHDAVAISQSNFMTNILPQAANMNRGAWYATEKVVECYRDREELWISGGPIWTGDRSNDLVLNSHGIETPEAFWKVIVKSDGDAIGWIVPNTQDAKARMLDRYQVPIHTIEETIGEKMPVTDAVRFQKRLHPWRLPSNCHLG